MGLLLISLSTLPPPRARLSSVSAGWDRGDIAKLLFCASGIDLKGRLMSLGTWQKTALFFARMYFLVAHPRLTRQFVRQLKFWPNAGTPKRYHEKVLWRKIVDHNPIFPNLAD